MEESEENEKNELLGSILKLAIGILICLIGIVINKKANAGDLALSDTSVRFNPYYIGSLIMIFIGDLILLSGTIKEAIEDFKEEHEIGEDFLVVIACIGAFFIGYHFEGFMVIVLYEIGEMLEEYALDKSRKSIADLMNIKPEFANLKQDGEIKVVKPEEVKIGDTILVKTGEKIPLDGTVCKGEANLDTSSLTGESKLYEAKKGSKVLSGSINTDGIIEVVVEAEYENSTVQKILELVESASEKKAKTETFVDKFTKIYTPVVVILAILIGALLPLFTTYRYVESLYRAFIFILVSCPCAIAISIPLTYFMGIGKASRSGILIKGSNYIDALNQLNNIVFDKTGTLTKGEFVVEKVHKLSDLSEDEILRYATIGEKYSNHPISKAIIEYANQKNIDIDDSKMKDFKETAGKGISYELDGKKVQVGNAAFVEYKDKVDGTTIFVKVGDTIAGYIVLGDEIKDNAKNIIEKLNKKSIQTHMFTGDSAEIANRMAKELEIENVKSQMLPQDKYNELEKIIKNNSEKEKTAFVGDGINDTPVLSLADVGIAMGASGATSAIEASDIVIMNDELDNILKSINISKKTCRIVKENLFFAILVKLLVLFFSSLGMLGMAWAVFADVGVTMICILNSFRVAK